MYLGFLDIDDNHYQDARTALSKIASKDDFWPSVKVEDMPAKGQVIDKVNLDLRCINTLRISEFNEGSWAKILKCTAWPGATC